MSQNKQGNCTEARRIGYSMTLRRYENAVRLSSNIEIKYEKKEQMSIQMFNAVLNIIHNNKWL
jgi:hypothetical protein